MPPVQEKSEVSRHQYQDLGFDSAEPEKVNHLKPEELQTRMLRAIPYASEVGR